MPGARPRCPSADIGAIALTNAGPRVDKPVNKWSGSSIIEEQESLADTFRRAEDGAHAARTAHRGARRGGVLRRRGGDLGGLAAPRLRSPARAAVPARDGGRLGRPLRHPLRLHGRHPAGIRSAAVRDAGGGRPDRGPAGAAAGRRLRGLAGQPDAPAAAADPRATRGSRSAPWRSSRSPTPNLATPARRCW